MDERQWLLATAYNTGTECLQSVLSHQNMVSFIGRDSSVSLFDEARRWFEAATVICRFVPGGKERAEKVCRLICCDRCQIFVLFVRPNLPHLRSIQISESYTQLLARYQPDKTR